MGLGNPKAPYRVKGLTFLPLGSKNRGMSVIGPYASPIIRGAAGTRPRLGWVYDPLISIYCSLLLVAVVFGAGTCDGAESDPAQPVTTQIEGTNSEQLIRTCLQIQQQLQTMQVAIEQNRKEAAEATEQNAAALSNRLQVLQEAFTAQQKHDMELLESSSQSMQRSNRAMLVVAGTIAGICGLSLLVMTGFQWRMSRALAAISTGLGPMSRGLGPPPELAALGPGDGQASAGGASAQSNLRLLSAIEQLDRHIHDFKGIVAGGGNGGPALERDRKSGLHDAEPAASQERSRISSLLDKGQLLLNEDNANAALACFDEVLSIEPTHKEALVRKGAALERQQKLNEAIECYDRAIAVDGSMTIAYLHKGGLCNRLERFKEALECYEKALRTHDLHGI